MTSNRGSEQEYRGPKVPESGIYSRGKSQGNLLNRVDSDLPINVSPQGVLTDVIPDNMVGEETNPEEMVNKRGMNRRQFLRFVAITGGVGLLGIAGLQLGRWTHVWERITRPSWREYESNVDEGTVLQLSLFDERSSDPENNGIAILARTIAKASSVYDPAIPKGVVFTDVNTWGKSGLRVTLESLDKMLNLMSTADGRDDLRSYIDKHGDSLGPYYLANVQRYESYLTSNHKSLNGSQDEVIEFMETSKEQGGLGYEKGEAQIVLDSVRAYNAKNITNDLKVRWNRINEKSGSGLRIP